MGENAAPPARRLDLTQRGIDHTRTRLELIGYAHDVRHADAEHLPFEDASFDIVYSWGVLHHTPNTPGAIEEVRRILRPGGVTRVMIYHRASLIGVLLWTRYALLRGRPFTSLDSLYSRWLESPGTKAYSTSEARQVFSRFASASTSIALSNGDLLTGAGSDTKAYS